MSRFTVTDLPLAGLKRIQRQRLGDNRGFLARLFCADELAAAGWTQPIAQINHTHTALRGTVRGMHFQRPPHAEMKLVSCLKGRVWDVAVDLRHNSPTFLHWHAEELSPINRRMMAIPEGFAHGFQVLDSESELLYLHTAFYTPVAEAGLRHDDPYLAIEWPISVTDISARDAMHPFINSDFSGIAV
jgi:dTDP-4-dehydrorhamnose 3,5-epimerase